jgi:hypothetical protein
MKATLLKNDSITEQNDFATKGYAVIELPSLNDEILASFSRMPRDGHSLQRLREIRLSQYFGYWEEGQWIFALLPRRKYIQSAEYIRLAEAGGVFRHREQLKIDPSSLIARVMDNLPVDRSSGYHINVNQIRVIANAEFRGVTVPEGPHRDGHEFSVVGIAQRRNVHGGETQIIDPKTKEIVFRTTLQENQAILIDDERYIHYATDIAPLEGDSGYRDIWVIEINRWDKRAYGPRHERLASAAAL